MTHHHPHHKPEDHEKWNNEMAIKHNPDAFITQTAFPIRWMEAARIGASLKYLDAQPEDHVIDLGCGAGNMLVQISAKKVVGLDISDFLLDLARKRCTGQSHIEIKKGQGEKIDFPDNSFDKLICSEVMEHVQDPEGILREMNRVVKPGGRVVITVPNEDLINFFKKILLSCGLKKFIAGGYNMSDNMLDEWHVNEIDDQWVRDHIGSLFTLKKFKSIPFSFLPFHRLFVLEVRK